MTRRPKSRLPPKLPSHPEPVVAAERPPRLPSPRQRLKAGHVAGRSDHFDRDTVLEIIRRLLHGDAAPRLGLPPFSRLTTDQVAGAVEGVYGWTGDGPRARIAPVRTVEAFTAATLRVAEVAAAGGRLMFATGRPASLLVVHRALADMARAAGGTILHADESALLPDGTRRLRWIDDVAVVTDGTSLVATDSIDAADELFFTLPRPDLVVADRAFAGTAVHSGHEVVAFADLDALALAVAAWRGMDLRVVPLDERRPPSAYAPLLESIDLTVD